VPVPTSSGPREAARRDVGRPARWDYIYEPDARDLLDGMMRRYLEAIVFQMVNENMASEQSARMVAMKAHPTTRQDHQELQLIYNKTRQAAITKELSEIVGGAARFDRDKSEPLLCPKIVTSKSRAKPVDSGSDMRGKNRTSQEPLSVHRRGGRRGFSRDRCPRSTTR
jgi:hypothetical protein